MSGGKTFWARLEEYSTVEQIAMVRALMKLSPRTEKEIVDTPEFNIWIKDKAEAILKWRDDQDKKGNSHESL